MAKIYLKAKGLGFCPGVRRAIRMAEKVLESGDKVYVIGDLIHNEGEMQRLKMQGLRVANCVEEIPPDAFLLIRAHGAPPEIIKKAKDKGVRIIDCTCSRVRRAQITALKLFQENRKVFIFGDREHPEVRGILGYIGGAGCVIESEEELENIPVGEKVGLLCQTTKGGDKFRKIAQLLGNRVGDLRFEDTSCPEVEKRRKVSIELAKEVDIMLIVGGVRSANTKRLKEACERLGVRSYLVERAEDLRQEWFEEGKVVGITAGLSTPLWEIREIENKLKEILRRY